MPLIDIECTECHEISEVHRPLAMYPHVPACPKCDNIHTRQVHLPQAARTLPPAVVVYRAPNGEYRFPGETSGAATAKYDRMGYTRIEARGWAEVRALESKMSARESSKMRFLAERRQEQRERGESLRRSELFHRMRTMSPLGRDLARRAIEQSNAKSRRDPTESRVSVEVYSDNRSSREQHRDDRGHRTRD